MKKLCDFINECGTFFVLTISQNQPFGRPFGAIMELDDKLYVATSPKKKVYEQILNNKNVQLVAIKSVTREWVRINGTAIETKDDGIKEKMLETCPILKKHYSSYADKNYAVFEISVTSAELN